MSRFMITHSLLSSWQYAIKDNPYEDLTNQRDPLHDFIRTLHREPIETSDAMQKGIDFENIVTDILGGKVSPVHHPWAEAGRAVATLIRGAQLQHRASRTVQIGGLDILLYGRLDALKAGVIYDIKYTASYEVGKYFDSTQHPMYLALVPGATDFTYLISNGSQVWPEHYRREESPDIIPIIVHFLTWLKTQNLEDVFLTHWKAM